MKTAITLITALAFYACTVNPLFAATLKCTVDKVEGEHVVLYCGKDTEKLQAGVKVKIKTIKAGSAIEGS